MEPKKPLSYTNAEWRVPTAGGGFTTVTTDSAWPKQPGCIERNGGCSHQFCLSCADQTNILKPLAVVGGLQVGECVKSPRDKFNAGKVSLNSCESNCYSGSGLRGDYGAGKFPHVSELIFCERRCYMSTSKKYRGVRKTTPSGKSVSKACSDAEARTKHTKCSDEEVTFGPRRHKKGWGDTVARCDVIKGVLCTKSKSKKTEGGKCEASQGGDAEGCTREECTVTKQVFCDVVLPFKFRNLTKEEILANTSPTDYQMFEDECRLLKDPCATMARLA